MAIDVYHGTGPVNWKRVKAAGHSLGIVKATEGISFRDTTMPGHLRDMKAVDMVRGVYHFMHVDFDPVKQAQNFWNYVATTDFDSLKEFPLALDLEDRPGLTRIGAAKAIANIAKFLEYIESRTDGRRMIIYGDVDFLSKLQGSFAGHPLWVAQYNSLSAPHSLPTGWKEYVLWQYDEFGKVDGISGHVVDLNRFNPALNGGGEEGLRKWVAEH